MRKWGSAFSKEAQHIRAAKLLQRKNEESYGHRREINVRKILGGASFAEVWPWHAFDVLQRNQLGRLQRGGVRVEGNLFQGLRGNPLEAAGIVPEEETATRFAPKDNRCFYFYF